MTDTGVVNLEQQLIDEIGPEGLDIMMARWLAVRHRDRMSLTRLIQKPASSDHYREFVRQQPCGFCQAPAPVEPHHHGSRGLGQKADDYRCAPACARCHRKAHEGKISTIDVDRAAQNTLVLYTRLKEGT